MQPEDEGFYYCIARDFVNGGEDDDAEVIVQDRVKLLVRRHPLQHHQNKLVNKMKNRTSPSSSNSLRRKSSKPRYRRPTTRLPSSLLPPLNQQKEQLIQKSLSQSRQTTSISTLIKFLTTKQPSPPPPPPLTSPAESLEPIIQEQLKRTELSVGGIGGDGTASLAKKSMTSERDYVICDSADNTCLNGGSCYITNPNLYTDISTYNENKIKFCM